MRQNRRESASLGGTGLALARLEELLEMMISKAAVGFLVGVGIAAGAGGAYIATKASAPAAETAPQSNALASNARTTGPVEQSEAVVNDPPSAALVTEAAS